MRSPARLFTSFGLGCLLLVTLFGSAWAEVAGKITGVRLDADEKTIVIDAKGNVGKHVARVLGNPNRLVMDFSDTASAMNPPRTEVGKAGIHEIRVGETNSRTRVVVDFRSQPVPSFKIKREKDQILVMLGGSVADEGPAALQQVAKAEGLKGQQSSPLDPSFVPATARIGTGVPADGPAQAQVNTLSVQVDRGAASGAARADDNKRIRSASAQRSVTDGSVNRRPESPDARVAQRMDNRDPNGARRPAGGQRPANESEPTSSEVPPSGQPAANRQMVTEVRPPVTPPTPDPRLLVQEITELRFYQVGHNARLMIRGGDQLDYRLNKVSPTKLRLDLINAEIPKGHQKPLRTDMFSTSVEMIVPGSQHIFIQLKDAVAYQVEKQKGVLMVDFPPPRFVAERGSEREGGGGGGEASRIIQEEQIRKRIESRNQDIERLQKGLEQLQKQRLEILKSYQITPDPEIFKKPVTMDFQGIALKNAFRLLAEQAGINIIVGGEVAGTTTLRLFDVPMGQVLDTILNTHGLDRVMVGNVMRVGSRAVINQYKEERRREYVQRIEEVDRRIERSRTEMQGYQREIEKWLEELKALQEAPVDETKAEEIGEAGCIDIEGEKVCFQYATIRVTYVRPSTVVPTLRCLFRLDCPGAVGATGVTTTVQSDLQRAESLYQAGVIGRAGLDDQLRQQGFSPDSPGAQARMQTYDRTQAALQRSAAAIATAAGVSQRPTTAQVALPFGEDPKLARILAYGILWANDNDRMIFVKDTPERIAQMKKLIYTLDIPTPQVLIESRIVQATRDWSRGLGIMWGGRSNQQGPYTTAHSTGAELWNRAGYWGLTGLQGGPTTNQATGQTTNGSDIPSGFVVNLPTTVANMPNLIGMGMQFGYLAGQYITELDARIQLGESTGKAKTISRPKVQVLDGQTASIRNGLSIPYQTVSADGTQTQMISADLSLNVSPTIFADGRVRMRVTVTNNEPEIVPGAPAPAIRTREANTQMIVKDGETAVIGGILQNTDGQSRAGMPGLMNIPPLSFLFSTRGVSRRVTELLVFLTPTIIRRPPPAS